MIKAFRWLLWLYQAGQEAMVPVVGLEPTLLAEPDFESGASTNSTTPASALVK